MAMSKKDKERARETADKLLMAFSWRETKEGGYYWVDVHDRLKRISEKGE